MSDKNIILKNKTDVNFKHSKEFKYLFHIHAVTFLLDMGFSPDEVTSYLLENSIK